MKQDDSFRTVFIDTIQTTFHQIIYVIPILGACLVMFKYLDPWLQLGNFGLFKILLLNPLTIYIMSIIGFVMRDMREKLWRVPLTGFLLSVPNFIFLYMFEMDFEAPVLFFFTLLTTLIWLGYGFFLGRAKLFSSQEQHSQDKTENKPVKSEIHFKHTLAHYVILGVVCLGAIYL